MTSITPSISPPLGPMTVEVGGGPVYQGIPIVMQSHNCDEYVSSMTFTPTAGIPTGTFEFLDADSDALEDICNPIVPL